MTSPPKVFSTTVGLLMPRLTLVITDRRVDSTLRECRQRALAVITTTMEEAKDDERFLLIADDVLQYSSMRRELYCIARDCGAAFLLVHVRCELETCISRDATRVGIAHIGREVSCLRSTALMRNYLLRRQVIERMSSSFESFSVDHIWERHVITIDNNSEET
jgi:tRNA uridine 5-carbamoylmethylation protein Kti12